MFRSTRAPLRITAAAALTAGLVVAGTATADAKSNRGEVRAAGNCSASTDWKLKAKLDDGRVEVEFEVDSNRSGQSWSVKLADNGTTVLSTTRRTAGPSGSFSVERRITNQTGSDRITGTARNAATGERCSGVVVFVL